MIVNHVDDNGLNRRYLLPDGADIINIEEGIPIDFYNEIMDIYQGAPKDFTISLCKGLWNQGLVERDDFLKPDASTRFRRAMLSTIKHDAFRIISIAKGKNHD